MELVIEVWMHCRQKADTSAKTAFTTRAFWVLMDFEHESAEPAEAQPATPGTMPFLPSEIEDEQHELAHLPFSKVSSLRTCQGQRESPP